MQRSRPAGGPTRQRRVPHRSHDSLCSATNRRRVPSKATTGSFVGHRPPTGPTWDRCSRPIGERRNGRIRPRMAPMGGGSMLRHGLVFNDMVTGSAFPTTTYARITPAWKIAWRPVFRPLKTGARRHEARGRVPLAHPRLQPSGPSPNGASRSRRTGTSAARSPISRHPVPASLARCRCILRSCQHVPQGRRRFSIGACRSV